MPYRCAAPNCNTKEKCGMKRKLFTFPKDNKLRTEWEIRCRGKNWRSTKDSRLCEWHFLDSEFLRKQPTKKLKKDAVPTRFEHEKSQGTKKLTMKVTHIRKAYTDHLYAVGNVKSILIEKPPMIDKATNTENFILLCSSCFKPVTTMSMDSEDGQIKLEFEEPLDTPTPVISEGRRSKLGFKEPLDASTPVISVDRQSKVEFQEPLSTSITSEDHRIKLEFEEPLDASTPVVSECRQNKLRFKEPLDTSAPVISDHQIKLEIEEPIDTSVTSDNHQIKLEVEEPLDTLVISEDRWIKVEFQEPLDDSTPIILEDPTNEEPQLSTSATFDER